MLIKYKLPKTILWVTNLLVLFFVIFTLFRLATFFAFKPEHISFADVVPSFLMGVQYDMRWISIVLLPIIACSIVPRLSPFYSSRNKAYWTGYLVLITFFVFFFFAADMGSFSYNQTRLDAGAMNFVEDPGISVKMMWQTYPLFWMLLGLLVAVLLFRWMYFKSHWHIINRTDGHKIPHRPKYFIIAGLILMFFIWGRFSVKPLTAKACFSLNGSFSSYLALNPLQNFFSTLQLRQPVFSEELARKNFPVIADLLQLRDKENFGYKRVISPGSNALESKPNVVLVLCESFSMYKSTMSGNPLNTTPFFDSLCKNGIFFERCFTPHFSTARGLFATITGIPDVQLFKFSTRNPQAIQQHTIIDNFEGYNKHYFLGGSAGFNNFEGLIKNIDGLQMHTEGSFTAQPANVWGISDKDLFYEANKVFKQEKKPFFAIVQTAYNHRPYMIPEADTDFVKKTVSIEELLKYGFESLDEYNTFRYSDYSFQKFMEAAQKESYFHNTIFVFIGDHGVAGNATEMYPPVWTSARLTDEHVPFLIYAPHLLQPMLRSEVVSQIDVLPTIAGLIQQPYINTTLGRNVLDTAKRNNYAFITNTAGTIGMVTDEFYFTKNLNYPQEQLMYMNYVPKNYSTAQLDSVKKRLSEQTTAIFETARYMLMNNKSY